MQKKTKKATAKKAKKSKKSRTLRFRTITEAEAIGGFQLFVEKAVEEFQLGRERDLRHKLILFMACQFGLQGLPVGVARRRASSYVRTLMDGAD